MSDIAPDQSIRSSNTDDDESGSVDRRSHSEELLQVPGNPVVLRRDQHCISRASIDPDALKVMYRLIRQGYLAFLVGGAVRDLLLRRRPKDFDVGTDARPDQVRRLFRNSRLIGRRFKINQVYFHGNKIIEVSTFRADSEKVRHDGDLIVRDDNNFGDPQTDAFRRDLTINGLFYDLKTFSVIDYVGGIADLEKQVVRVIGDPEIRFREDPVRMIRAVRHAARTGFKIDPRTQEAISQHVDLLQDCPAARIWEESLKDFKSGAVRESFKLFHDTGLLYGLFPVLSEAIDEDGPWVWERMEAALGEIDSFVGNGYELPNSVSYLAPCIGTLTVEALSGPDDVVPAGALIYFLLPSELPGEGEPPVVIPKATDRGGRRGRGGRRWRKPLPPPDEGASESNSLAGQSALVQSALTELFIDVGLPRGDREEMVDLLLMRRALLKVDNAGDAALRLVDHPLFEKTLLLMRLTSHDEITRRCVAGWESLVGSSVPDRDRHSDRGGAPGFRRGGGSRRRRSGHGRGRR